MRLDGCTGLTALPDNLTVGGSLYLSGCTGLKNKGEQRQKVRKLKNGDYAPEKYICCDGILTHIKKTVKLRDYTLYVGKIKGRNVVSDGESYAHCEKLRDGIADINFKRAKDRGADQYKDLTLDTVVKLEDAVTMYRIITGACRAGSAAFVESLGHKLKKEYTVRECIEITKGQYNAERFAEFFGQ